MDISDLRIALFSGNYNYTRDGANQALNRLVGSLLAKGAKVRVYSPKVANPDFPATGDLVGLPNVPMPVKGRGEYRMPTRLGAAVKRDLEAFAPDIVHLSSNIKILELVCILINPVADRNNSLIFKPRGNFEIQVCKCFNIWWKVRSNKECIRNIYISRS